MWEINQGWATTKSSKESRLESKITEHLFIKFNGIEINGTSENHFKEYDRSVQISHRLSLRLLKAELKQ